MIELKKVTKEYSKGIAALNGVNIKIEQGEFVFVVGDSGAGKSTFIRLLMKELEPTSGSIRVMDQNLGEMTHQEVPYYRRKIGVVFQDFRLLKDRNVYENVAFALRVTETSSRVIKKKVPAALSLVGKNDEFGELHDYYTHRPGNPLKKKQSLVAVACKFLRVAYKILTTGVDYDAGKMLNDIKRPQKQLPQAA